MSKRLQVLLDERELKALQRIARRKGTTTAEWVRQALRAAQLREVSGAPGANLEAVRAAAQYAFPTADIDEMLADISRGASAGAP